MIIFRKAILIIHGFLGSPYDTELLARYLELDRNFDVYTFTLPGHENGFMMNNKYEEWIDASEKQVEFLIHEGYNSIYVIGHSMGGVIAGYLATKYQEIKKLVLAAPAYIYVSKNDKKANKLKHAKDILNDYGYEKVLKRAIKMSFNSLKEFSKLIEEYYDYPKDIRIPTFIIQGLDDNLVDRKSAMYVYEKVKYNKRLIFIKGVNHDMFHSTRANEINEIIKRFLKSNYIKTEIIEI